MGMGLDHGIHGAFHVLCFTMLRDYVLCNYVIDIHGVINMENTKKDSSGWLCLSVAGSGWQAIHLYQFPIEKRVRG